MKEGVDENVSDEMQHKEDRVCPVHLYEEDDSGQSVQMTDDEKKAEKEKATEPFWIQSAQIRTRT